MAYREVFWKAFDALALSGVFAVELLWVELFVQPQCLHFAVQPR